MELNKEQTEKATILLGLLCKSSNLNNVQIASFFDNDNIEAIFVCKTLEDKDLLKAIWLDGNRIASIDKKENTCNAFKTDFLLSEFVRRDKLENSERFRNKPIEYKSSNFMEKIKKIHKTTIWVIGGIVILLTAVGLIFDNLDRLTKYLKEKESKPKQEVTQNPNDNVSKNYSLTKK